MADTHTAPWLIPVPAELVTEYAGAARFTVTRTRGADAYAGPAVAVQTTPAAPRAELPAPSSWRAAARALAPV